MRIRQWWKDARGRVRPDATVDRLRAVASTEMPFSDNDSSAIRERIRNMKYGNGSAQ